MQADNLRKQKENDASKCGIILSYHRVVESEFDPWGLRVSPENFAHQLSVLREFGNPMSLPRFAAAYQAGKPLESAIVITFDDGYVDNSTHALPLLKSLAVPATIFVSTGYTGQPYFWWEALENVFLRPNRLPQKLTLQLDNGPVEWSLGDASRYTGEQYERDRVFCEWRGKPGSRIRIYHDIYEVLWSLEHTQRLLMVNEIISWAGVDPRSFSNSRPMTTKEIRDLGNETMITIGAHSVNHLPLDEESAQTQKSEILEGRKFLESILNRPVTTFAYPHGKFSAESIIALRENGFICACTTEEKTVGFSTDPMLMPRFTIKDWGKNQFMEKLTEWL